MSQGFFKLQRRMFTHWLWKEVRELSRFEAFLDLLQLAAFEPTERLVSGRCIYVPVGGIVASERFLSGRWKWSRTKVRQFLDLLQSEKMAEPQKDQGITVLILCNYEAWNGKSDAKKTTDQPGEDQAGTSGKPKIRRKRTPRAEKKDVDPADLPFVTDAFQDAWEEWEQYLKQKGGNLTTIGRNKQLKQLKLLTEADAIATINNAILRGWKGLYPNPNPRGSADRNAGTANAGRTIRNTTSGALVAAAGAGADEGGGQGDVIPLVV